MDSAEMNAVPPRIEGFGSADVTTPFNYGSVNDGFRPPSLEQKLKKKYWKTKQTVIQKLGKDQDEFVVAGDAEIDSKLEKAYHLRFSCQALLDALDKYSFRIRALSSRELSMGQYLGAYSEREYTNASEVMKSVGKVQEEDAEARMSIVPALLRMQHEFATFMGSAIQDLDQSIHTLERARTEYRAALLWMKKVSGKLQNPDYRDQLAKYREAQAAVKETKSRFEKLKNDLSEKINMVSASRCNLLSHTLPNYQKVVLAFSDKAANNFHGVLAELRSQHHHQYKVKKLAQEIRDLELEEAFESGGASPDSESDTSERSVERGKEAQQRDDDDELLIDVGEPAPVEQGRETKSPPGATKSPPGATKLPSGDAGLMNIEQEARIKDLDLMGLETDLRELQSELIQQPPSSEVPSTMADELDDLLQLEPTQPPDPGNSQSSGSHTVDQLFDEWSSFSTIIPTTKSDAKSVSSEWEKEFSSGEEPLLDVDSFISSSEPREAQTEDGTGKKSGEVPVSATPSERQLPGGGLLQPQSTPHKAAPPETTGISTLDDLLAPLPQTSASTGDTPTGLESLDPTLFQLASVNPTLSLPTQTTTTLPSTSTALQPALLPMLQPQGLRQPYMFPPTASPYPGYWLPMAAQPTLATSQGQAFPAPGVPALSGMQWGMGGGAMKASGGGQFDAKQPQPKEKEEGKDKKGTSWMNVFAHLDPLVNEKV